MSAGPGGRGWRKIRFRRGYFNSRRLDHPTRGVLYWTLSICLNDYGSILKATCLRTCQGSQKGGVKDEKKSFARGGRNPHACRYGLRRECRPHDRPDGARESQQRGGPGHFGGVRLGIPGYKIMPAVVASQDVAQAQEKMSLEMTAGNWDYGATVRLEMTRVTGTVVFFKRKMAVTAYANVEIASKDGSHFNRKFEGRPSGMPRQMPGRCFSRR
jgi:hypothetical protein